jgi:hypothetical protein
VADQYIGPTPQEPISGALAAALRKVLDYANKSGSYQKGQVDNPVLPHIADLLALPQIQRTLERVSYGDRLTQGSGETLQVKPDTLDAGMAAVPLAQALSKYGRPAAAALLDAMPSASSGSKAAQRGAITVGGNPDLYPGHGTSAEKLLATRSPSGAFELSGPSIGIAKGGVDTSFAHGPGGGVLLIPRVGAYDPATSPATMFNRDAYTPRDRQQGEYMISAAIDSRIRSLERSRQAGFLGETFPDHNALRTATLRGEAEVRNDAKLRPMNPGDLRGKEAGESLTGNWAHDEAIRGSPIFRSFKQFENSPLGAALLADKRAPSELTDGMIEKWQGQGALDKLFGQGFADFLNSPRRGKSSRVSSDELVSQMQNHYIGGNAGAGVPFNEVLPGSLREAILDWGSTPDHLNQAARQYRGLLKQTPSQYAELKVAGPTQLSPENWAGAVMLHPPIRSSASTYTTGGLKYEQDKLLDTLPIPSVPFDTAQSDEALTRLVQALQQQAGPARKQPLSTSYLPYLNNPP